MSTTGAAPPPLSQGFGYGIILGLGFAFVSRVVRAITLIQLTCSVTGSGYDWDYLGFEEVRVATFCQLKHRYLAPFAPHSDISRDQTLLIAKSRVDCDNCPFWFPRSALTSSQIPQ
jgi:hypothetical protein